MGKSDQAPALHLDRLERAYAQGSRLIEVLKGATASLYPGEAVALLGPSGAGKSTLLHIAGLGLGVLVCLNIELIREFVGWITDTELFSPELYYLSQLPAEMDTGETASVVIMALVLSVLATLYPSWRASRLDPVEALRYE